MCVSRACEISAVLFLSERVTQSALKRLRPGLVYLGCEEGDGKRLCGTFRSRTDFAEESRSTSSLLFMNGERLFRSVKSSFLPCQPAVKRSRSRRLVEIFFLNLARNRQSSPVSFVVKSLAELYFVLGRRRIVLT